MKLSVLSVAYPLSEVTPDAVDGAEQVLLAIDEALHRAGHRSIVVACEGSATHGTLIPLSRPAPHLTEVAKSAVRQEVRNAIHCALPRFSIDVVHLHGVDFAGYLPPPGVPAVATLHLPPSWYPSDIFDISRPQTYLQCVSHAAHRSCPATEFLLPPIENGIPVERFSVPRRKRNFVVALSRICPEKGLHLAIDAAREAGIPLLIGGRVFHYDEHVRYFEQEMRPRLATWGKFLGPLGFNRKRRLLAAAQCVLIPSLVHETSSLVAMEALACGTPVVGFRFPALEDILQHGRTGFLVSDAHEMALAIPECGKLDPEECRDVARTRFSLEKMTGAYLSLYERLAQRSRSAIT